MSKRPLIIDLDGSDEDSHFQEAIGLLLEKEPTIQKETFYHAKKKLKTSALLLYPEGKVVSHPAH